MSGLLDASASSTGVCPRIYENWTECKLQTIGMTMVIVTHEMSFAREVGTRMIFLDKGDIIEDGPPKQVMDHPKTERARQFFDADK